MKIQQIRRDKDEYMEMLLMADPCKDVINSYLDKGEMFALVNGGDVCAVCVVELLKNRKCELKSIVTRKEEQGKGYAKYLLRHVCEHYGNQCDTMYAGTGNRRKTLEFLGKCGFVNSHIVANYYPEHYREPIYEGGVRLTDKIYLKKQLDSEVNVKKVVDLALEAGRILLKNGAEIFRVDETMTYTKVKQVPLSSSHLGIVAEVNELSREISDGLVGIEEAGKRLKEIDRIPEKRGYFQVFAAGAASGCYGYFLGASALESMAAFCIGCILYVWVLAAKKQNLSKMIVNIMGGVIITALAIGVCHLPLPQDVQFGGMIIGSIMPLVPGLAFVNAIRDIADSDFLSGTVRMIDALLVFVYIAVGVGVTLSVYNRMGGGLML